MRRRQLPKRVRPACAKIRGARFPPSEEHEEEAINTPPQDANDTPHEEVNVQAISVSPSTLKVSKPRSDWNKSDMNNAMKDVEDYGYSTRAAAKKWGIPATTLTSWLMGITTTKRKGPPTILTDEEEMEIVSWCHEMADMGHGLEIIQLKTCVAQICETRSNPFTDGFPGKSWWAGFKKRHPDLTLRTAEGLDKDRAVCLRPSIVSSFYINLSKAYEANPYGPNRIWNCDETGLQAGRNCGMRVLAKRGSRSVPYIIPKSREWITILCCVNAAGQSIPGFYLFKGKSHLENYIAGCEPGACMATQSHAWMTKDLFMNWLHHFASSVPGGVSPTNRHLLIFDGHGSHVALGTIQEARSLGIDLLTLPAHTSHKLQPLDVSVFAPFKTYFKEERRKWIVANHGIDVKRAELAELGSKAFKRALTPSNIKAGFKRTGIWPLNPNALDEDMAPSRTFDTSSQDDAGAAENMLHLSRVDLQQSEDVQMVPNTQLEKESEPQQKEININECVAEQLETPNRINQIDESLSLPTEDSPPDWMKEAALNLGVNLNFNNEEVSLSLPSHPTLLHDSDLVHYYVGNQAEDNDADSQLEAAGVLGANSNQTCEADQGQKTLGRFLKLPVEKVRESSRSNSASGIRLSRESLLITADQYMELLVEKEKRKKEIDELKQRKKEQIQEKKAERIVERERKEQEKIEKEYRRKTKEHQKLIERQEREQRKEQERIQRDQEIKEKEFEKARRELERKRRLSSPINPFPDQHPMLRELMGIHCPLSVSTHNIAAGVSASPSSDPFPTTPVRDVNIGRQLQSNTPASTSTADSTPPFLGFWK
ncbi:hypothetical protein KI387_042776 [Taxus chinensis]|uniref:HTH CENPB-type domain-containing protein n=1 Tax=Taxus chinensis TaxID=29808 RepID=A0AA38C9F7_TAXCH|nr:hypothetical protein KI387_042776 [Taxus chinensis]